MTLPTFIRFQSPVESHAGVHAGVFGLLNVLGRGGRLSEPDEEYRVRQNAWFEDAFPDPSTVNAAAYGANRSATAWFKSATAGPLVDALRRHFEILDAHGVAWERVESDDPGRVVYEDGWQLVVVPHEEFIVQGAHQVDVEALDA